MTLKESISSILRERRNELGLTMEELALLVWGNPKKRSEISRYEKGTIVPTITTLDKLLEALRLRVEILKK